jgi:ABC-type multidrug transport system fused ATPase/permease subunit
VTAGSGDPAGRAAAARESSLAIVRRCLGLMAPRARRRWAALVPLALAGAAAEALAAAGLFGLITIVGDPARAATLPVAATIHGWLPWRDARSVVLSFTALLAAFSLAKSGFQVLQAYAHSRLVAEGIAALSGRMLDAYLGAPYAWHLRHNSARLVRDVLASSEIAYRGVMASAIALAFEACVVGAIVAVLLVVAPLATLAVTVPLAAAAAVLARATRTAVERWGARAHELTGGALQSLQQTFGALKEIKVLQREAYFYDAFARRQRALVRVRHLHTTLAAVPRVLVETLFVGGAFGLILAVALLGRGGPEVLPVLGLYAYAGFRIIPSVNRMLLAVGEIRGGGAAVRQLDGDLAALGRRRAAEDAARDEDGVRLADRIAFEGVGFAYEDGEGPVLREITLSIRRGESIGVVGATGSGKSTFVDLLIGVLDPSTGRITIDGRDLRERRRAWQRGIGYVPQRVGLVDDTLRRNVALGVPDERVDEARLRRAVRLARLEETVAGLSAGLDTAVGEDGARLSGGERQRVGIARALYHEPDVLVFDEATAALDNRTEAELMRGLAELPGTRTLVVVAHRLGTVRRCDRLVFLRDGRIDDVGPYDDLLAHNDAFRALAARADDGA